MFIGHFGVGFAAKKIDRTPSLGTMFLAAQFIDLLWPILILTGIEKVKIEQGNTAFTPLNFISYPFSHSLFFVLIWSVLFGLIYFLIRKNLRASVLLGSLVLSHWILDLFTHRPDLQIFPWSDLKVGLGLWNSVPFTMLIEISIYLLGALFYLQVRKSQQRKNYAGIVSMIVFLLLIYMANIFGSTPPSDSAIGLAGLGMWLFVAWAYWIDRKKVEDKK